MYRLMIVDDSNIIRSRISKMLSDFNIEIVAKAKDGKDALAKFQTYQPEIITMDLTMPHVDGLECIQKITATGIKTNILVVSALSDKATGLQALKYGARGFICKPFTEEDLQKALTQLIRQLR